MPRFSKRVIGRAFPPWCPTLRMLVHECWMIVEHIPHRAGIVLPIGGKPPDSRRAASGTPQGRRNRRSAIDACGAVPCAMDPERTSRRNRRRLGQRTDRKPATASASTIRTLRTSFADELDQHAGDGRLVHLEGEEIGRWPRFGHRHQRIAGTWSDLDDQRCRAAEGGVQIDRHAWLDRRGRLGAGQAQHELVVVPLPGPPLLWTHPGAPADERGDVPPHRLRSV